MMEEYKEYLQIIEEQKKKIKKMERLLKIIPTIVGAEDPDNLLNIIMYMAEQIMEAEAASLMLIDKGKNMLEFKVVLGEVAEKIKDKKIKIGQGISGWVAKTGEYLLSNDPYNDPRFDPSFDKATGFKTRSYLCMPLKLNNKEVVGTLLVLNKIGKKGFDEEDVNLFKYFCDLSAIVLKHHGLVKENEFRENIQRELKIAHTIQQGFLPKHFPLVDNFNFNAINIPARFVGGDFYDIFEIQKDKVAVIIGDVSGKGVSSALFMTKICSDIRLLIEIEKDPIRLISRLNNIMVEKSQNGMFASLILLIIDCQKCESVIINAGHLPPIILRKNKVSTFNNAPNPPIGIIKDMDFFIQKHTFHKSERMVLFTDGVIDIEDKNCKRLGFEQLKEFFSKNRTSTNLIEDLLCRLRKFSDPQEVVDDITIIEVACDMIPKNQKIRKSFTILSNPDELITVEKNLRYIMEQKKFSKKEKDLITVAVIEALANIIKHTYQNQTDKRIDIKIECIENLRIHIRDYGEPIQEDAIICRDLSEIKAGGFGLHLINNIMDKVEYIPHPDGNEIRMQKNFSN